MKWFDRFLRRLGLWCRKLNVEHKSESDIFDYKRMFSGLLEVPTWIKWMCSSFSWTNQWTMMIFQGKRSDMSTLHEEVVNYLLSTTDRLIKTVIFLPPFHFPSYFLLFIYIGSVFFWYFISYFTNKNNESYYFE